MVVVGSLAHGFDDARMAFAAGALTASLLWLAVLSIGSRLFARSSPAPRPGACWTASSP